jgi:putative endonuclease
VFCETFRAGSAKYIKLMYTVYVLHSKKENKFYIGLTENINRRLQEHKTGHNHTTLRYKTLKFIYLESYINKQDATRRERYFKTTAGKRTLRLMLKETLSD